MRTPLLIAAVLAAAPAVAAAQTPVATAEHRMDVDGDGQLDVIRVEDPPAVQVLITGPAGLTGFRPFAAAGRVTGGTITAARGKDGTTMIVGTIELDGRRREAMALRWRGRALEPVWSGPVGLQEPDRDWSYEVAATDLGLLRWQGRPGVIRCDDKPAWLFLEMWDPGGGRFRRVKQAPVRVDDKAPVLRAARGAPAPASDGSPPLIFRRALVSAQAGAARADELLPARELTDGDPRTAWREDQADIGRGELITVHSGGARVTVRAVRIIPGDAASPAALAAANRLRRAALLVGERAFWIEFPGDLAQQPATAAQPYWVTLDPPVEAACVSLIIDQVWSGTSTNTAIAELSVLTDLEMAPGGGLAELAAQVGAGGHTGEQAARALAAVGAAAAPALVAEADKPGQSGAVLLRLRRALAPLRAPAAVDQLLLGLRAGGDAVVMKELTDGLTAIGEAAVAGLAALAAHQRAPLGARRTAVRVLGAIPGDPSLAALLAVAGAEPAALRRDVGFALGRWLTVAPAPPDPMIAWHAAEAPLLEAVHAAEGRGDARAEATLWRAIREHAIGHPSIARINERVAPLRAAMAARLPTATGYELRYRLFEAAGSINDDGVLAALGPAIAATTNGRDARSAVLRRVTAAALGRNRSPAALALLVGLLADADPGTRRATARSLGERRDGDAASDAALGTMLAGDRWADVRGSAAGALGSRCDQSPAAATALTTALDGDRDVRVQTTALGALVGCRAPGTAKLLLRVIADRGKRYQLRIQAVGFAIALRDRRLVPALLARFDAARSEMLGSQDPDAPRLAAALAGGLGSLGDDRAVDPLMRAAADGAFPEVQAGAVDGLAHMCPKQARELVRELTGSPQESVKRAARGAMARCYR